MDMSLSKLWELMKDRVALGASVYEVAKNQIWLNNWIKLNWYKYKYIYFYILFLYFIYIYYKINIFILYLCFIFIIININIFIYLLITYI